MVWARAARVEITLSVKGANCEIAIRDDGTGFDLHESMGDHHLGLQIMRARAERTGGKVFIESVKGEGTTIIASFPLEIMETVDPHQT